MQEQRAVLCRCSFLPPAARKHFVYEYKLSPIEFSLMASPKGFGPAEILYRLGRNRYTERNRETFHGRNGSCRSTEGTEKRFFRGRNRVNIPCLSSSETLTEKPNQQSWYCRAPLSCVTALTILKQRANCSKSPNGRPQDPVFMARSVQEEN